MLAAQLRRATRCLSRGVSHNRNGGRTHTHTWLPAGFGDVACRCAVQLAHSNTRTGTPLPGSHTPGAGCSFDPVRAHWCGAARVLPLPSGSVALAPRGRHRGTAGMQHPAQLRGVSGWCAAFPALHAAQCSRGHASSHPTPPHSTPAAHNPWSRSGHAIQRQAGRQAFARVMSRTAVTQVPLVTSDRFPSPPVFRPPPAPSQPPRPGFLPPHANRSPAPVPAHPSPAPVPAPVHAPAHARPGACTGG